MSIESHREAMAAPLYRADMSPTLDDSAMGYPDDEAADKPIAEPWDAVWIGLEIFAGVLLLGFVAILAQFFYSNWDLLARIF